MMKVVVKQKNKSEYATYDKNILTGPSIKICPPVCSNVTFWAIFSFSFEGIPYLLLLIKVNMLSVERH